MSEELNGNQTQFTISVGDGTGAIPLPTPINNPSYLSPRDYCAAKALQGLLSYVSVDDWHDGEFKATAARRYADAAVLLTDAMFASLKSQGLYPALPPSTPDADRLATIEARLTTLEQAKDAEDTYRREQAERAG